jgi:meiotic recombination protein DMC1
VNVSEIKKLKDSGLMTIGQVMQQPMRHLVNIKGLTEARIEKIREACRKLLPQTNFKTGLEVKAKRQQVIKITTGSDAFDKILGGGIESGQIVEVFGEFRTGKTQLAHTLCVTSQLSFDSKGGQGKVIYVDTEGNFRPERIEEISERYGLDSNQTLENIISVRVFSHEEQMEIVKPIAGLLSDPDQGPYRVLIIDSIISLFRVEFSGRGELSERQQKLGIHLSHLEKLAEEFNIVVLILNQCTADPGALAMFGPVIKPVGGHVLAHASTTRIFLKKGKGEQRIAKIYDSPLVPEAEALFAITPGGIADVA